MLNTMKTKIAVGFWSKNNFNTENLFNLIIEIIKNKNKLETIRNNMKKNYKQECLQ